MVSSSTSQTKGSERINRSASLSTYTEQFNSIFPYYLSIGMSYEQFWEMDSTLVIFYRKADELRQQRKNQELWLQGMYIYEALCDASPLLHAFSRKGAKPIPYSSSPYALSKTDKNRQEQNENEVRKKNSLQFMEAFMIQHNRRFELSNEKG